MTDMERIYHPILPYSSEEVIEKIKNDEFSDNDARYVLLSITKRMNWLPLTPNKTASSSDVIPISFDIPTSCETPYRKTICACTGSQKPSRHTGCAHCKKGKHISRNKQIYGRRNRWIISK